MAEPKREKNTCAVCGKPCKPRKRYCDSCRKQKAQAGMVEYRRKKKEAAQLLTAMLEYPPPEYMVGFKVGQAPLWLQRVPAERIEAVIENLIREGRL